LFTLSIEGLHPPIGHALNVATATVAIPSNRENYGIASSIFTGRPLSASYEKRQSRNPGGLKTLLYNIRSIYQLVKTCHFVQ